MTALNWIVAPSPATAVAIVSTPQLAPELVAHLREALSAWDQVAYLQVSEPHACYQQWLDSQVCDARTGLGQLGKQCVLLDIEQGHAGELAWLGSVHGHPLQFLEVAGDAGAQSECVLAAARALVKQQLLEQGF